jgi:hypothetical protein
VRALENRISGLPDDARRALLVAAASGAESVQPVVDALGALGLDRGSSTPPSRPACCRWRAGVAVTAACAPVDFVQTVSERATNLCESRPSGDVMPGST